jgi:hypothetical protein
VGLDPGPLDGIPGVRTRHAIQAFLGRDRAFENADWAMVARRLPARQRPVRVLILQADTARSIRANRGLHGSSADAEAHYRNAGVATAVWANPSGGLAAAFAAETEPREYDVIHICAGMRTGRGTPELDFYSGDGGLPLPAFDLLLRGVTAALPPLVILDVNASSTRPETLRQLLLRNHFAGRLLRPGAADIVLATGLAVGPEAAEQSDRQRRLIAKGIAAGRSAADIARSLHSADLTDLESTEQAMPFLGSALFSTIGPRAQLPVGAM